MLRGKTRCRRKDVDWNRLTNTPFYRFCRISIICLRVHYYMYSLSMPIFTIGMLIVGSGFEKNMSSFCDPATRRKFFHRPVQSPKALSFAHVK